MAITFVQHHISLVINHYTFLNARRWPPLIGSLFLQTPRGSSGATFRLEFYVKLMLPLVVTQQPYCESQVHMFQLQVFNFNFHWCTTRFQVQFTDKLTPGFPLFTLQKFHDFSSISDSFYWLFTRVSKHKYQILIHSIKLIKLNLHGDN